MSHKKSLFSVLAGACGLLFALAAHATVIYSSQDGGSFRDDRTFVEHAWQPLAGFDSWKGLHDERGEHSRWNELTFTDRHWKDSHPETAALSEWLTDTFVLSGLNNYLKDRELGNLLREDRLIYGDGAADRLARLLGSGKNHKCGRSYGDDSQYAGYFKNGDCECSGDRAGCKHKKEVPEPGTLGLAGAALLGSAYLLVRRRRSAIAAAGVGQVS